MTITYHCRRRRLLRTSRRYLAVVIDIFDAAVEPFSVWGGLPMIVSRIEVLHVPAADLQRRIDVQVLIEWWYCALGLARGIVELWMRTVFQFGDVRRTAVVHHQTDVLKKKTKEP